jgi:AcrR family transcriptional regulator
MTATTTTARARQGEAKRATGRETRERLVDVAERLFADHGIDGVSIRSINAAAGLAPAAVHYHFGTKDRLLDAVVARRGARMMQHLDVLLDEVETAGPASVEDVLRATAEAMFAQIDRDPEGGRRWMKVIGHLTMSDDRRLQRINADEDGLDRLQRTVLASMPGVPLPFVMDAWRTAVTVLVQLLARTDAPADTLTDHQRRLVVAFVSGGFERTCAIGP